MKACPPWLYLIRVWPEASLEAETTPCPADWKITPEGLASRLCSTVHQYSEDTRLDHVWLTSEAPGSPQGAQPLSTAQGSADARPLKVDLKVLVPPRPLPVSPVAMLAFPLLGTVHWSVFFLLEPWPSSTF